MYGNYFRSTRKYIQKIALPVSITRIMKNHATMIGIVWRMFLRLIEAPNQGLEYARHIFPESKSISCVAR